MRSWWCKQASSTSSSCTVACSMRKPLTGWRCMCLNSSSVKAPGLFRCRGSEWALPMSCSRPAMPACTVCSALRFIFRASATIRPHTATDVHIGVVVRGLQARHADECVRVALYRNCRRPVPGCLAVDKSRHAHACFAEHAHDGVARFVAYGRCPRQLLAQRRWGGVGGERSQDGVWQRILCVHNPLRVSIHSSSTGLARSLASTSGVSTKKAVRQKSCASHGPHKVVDIHSSLQLFDTNLFEHKRGLNRMCNM